MSCLPIKTRVCPKYFVHNYSLKSDVNKLDIDKLETVPVHFKKLSDVDDKNILKKKEIKKV